MYPPLLSLDFKGTACALVTPRAGKRPIVESEVVEHAFDNVVQFFSRRTLARRFEPQNPSIGIERGVLDFDVVGTGIDDARDIFTVPIHDDDDIVEMIRAQAPHPQPGTFYGVTFLSRNRCRENQNRECQCRYGA